MQPSIVSLGLAATLLAASSLTANAAETLPSRRAGLWESKTIATDGSTVARQCIDETSDQLAQGAFGIGQACSKRNLVKTATGYETESECKIGPISAAGKGIITGDFGSKIRIETDTTLTGLPRTNEPVKRKLVVEATYLGPCEAGQSPGDIIMPDGKIVKLPAMPH